jgi:hypothetical protein
MGERTMSNQNLCYRASRSICRRSLRWSSPLRSGEVRLNESWAGMHINLAQDCVSGVDEAVGSVGGDDDNAAGLQLTRFIADGDGGAAFERECDLNIRMRVQWGTLAGLRVDDVGRERRAFFFANEFVRHPNKREFFKIHKGHGKTDARPAARDKAKVAQARPVVSVFPTSDLFLGHHSV